MLRLLACNRVLNTAGGYCMLGDPVTWVCLDVADRSVSVGTPPRLSGIDEVPVQFPP